MRSQGQDGRAMQPDSIIIYNLTVSNLLLSGMESLVTEPDLREASRYREASQRTLFLARRALRRWCLTKWIGSIDFEVDHLSGGKPFVLTGPQFNVSSTIGMVACAVSQTQELGLDIEAYQRMSDLNMSYSELKSWTEREAVAKATGRGISQAVDGLTLVAPGIYRTQDDAKIWKATSFELPGVIATVVVSNLSNDPITVTPVSWDSLKSL
jgi:phosphopantetheinyl transferase